jgi:hypothetical protein
LGFHGEILGWRSGWLDNPRQFGSGCDGRARGWTNQLTGKGNEEKYETRYNNQQFMVNGESLLSIGRTGLGGGMRRVGSF